MSTSKVSIAGYFGSDIDEITLPSMPHSEPSLPSVPAFSFSNNRKRPFLTSRESSTYKDQLAEAINTSSDPALFSSDETPDAENYSSGQKRRKKRIYKGTWWGDKLPKARAAEKGSTNDGSGKRHFRRNFDSGIFMCDDSSGTDLSSGSLLEQELLNDHEKAKSQRDRQASSSVGDKATKKLKINRGFTLATEKALKALPQDRPINPKDHMIRKVVQDCLDKNDENVDWTGMDLTCLPASITALKYLIKRIEPSAASFKLAPFEARLKVFLGNNQFTHFPEHLLGLSNIEILSMRQNSLSEIPPGIRNLVELQEFNISSNNLRYLPYEVVYMLRFCKLRIINESPNPWLAFPAVQDRFTDAPSIVVVSTTQKFLRRWAISEPEEFLPNGLSRQISTKSSSVNKQPHLSEIVLCALLKHNTSKSNLTSYLSEDHPQSVRDLLGLLHTSQSSGGRFCTFCNHSIVLPRYQWYEWWSYTTLKESQMRVIAKATNTSATWPPYCTEVYWGDIGTIDPDEEPDEATKEKLIPFIRMACGCVDIRDGLAQEVEQLKAYGMPLTKKFQNELKLTK